MTKTVRVPCGEWDGYEFINLATELFGKPGTQSARRWFYRVLEAPGKHWHKKGRRVNLILMLYFRNSADATFFCLKKSQY